MSESRMHSNNSNSPLTIDQIGQYAPSAIALQAHSSRSERYEYIPTLDVIKGMSNAGFMPFNATQSKTRTADKKEFTKHMIRFRQMSDMQVNAIVGNAVPEIVLVNSHDGTSAYKLMLGLWRFVCSNGMMVGSTLSTVRVKHQGDIVAQVIEASLLLANNAPAVLDTVNQWQALQLTTGEQSALASAAHVLRFADAEGHVKTPITPAQLLHIRRTADAKKDLWSTFNVIQENVIKGGLRARQEAHTDAEGRYIASRRVSTRMVGGIDQDVRLNKGLWTLAEEMAKLKQIS